jgi:hypothetical protein
MHWYINKQHLNSKTKKEIDGNNYLVAYDVPIAKTGIQAYSREELGEKEGDLSEMVNVYRDPSVFEDEKLIESFDGIPLVYRHPDNGKVDNHNYREFVVGSISGPYFKNNILYAKKITVIEKNAIVDILKKETNELSIGFRGKVIKKPGKYKGESYIYQEDVIHANHLALCEKGKAGSFYAINSVKGTTKMDITSARSVQDEHEMFINGMTSGDQPNISAEHVISQGVHSKMSKVKPFLKDSKEKELEEDDCMGNDSMEEQPVMENSSEEKEEDEGEEKKVEKKEKKFEKKEKKEKKEEKDLENESIEEAEHKDKDVINSLKSSNKKLRDLVNAKNKTIKSLELHNISLEETIDEAKEYMKNMAEKMKQSNLVNSMTGPDYQMGEKIYKKNFDIAKNLTSSFLYMPKSK